MEELLDLLNKNLKNLLIRKALKQIAASIPWLTWGPIGWFVEMCVTYLVEVVLEQANLYLTDKIVDNSVDKAVEKVDEVTDKLIEYEENVENYSEEELDELDEELMASYRDLFRF